MYTLIKHVKENPVRRAAFNQLAAELGSGIKTVTLAFTSEKADGYEISLWKDEDLTLFMKSGISEDLKGKTVRFPGLAHA